MFSALTKSRQRDQLANHRR